MVRSTIPSWTVLSCALARTQSSRCAGQSKALYCNRTVVKDFVRVCATAGCRNGFCKLRVLSNSPRAQMLSARGDDFSPTAKSFSFRLQKLISKPLQAIETTFAKCGDVTQCLLFEHNRQHWQASLRFNLRLLQVNQDLRNCAKTYDMALSVARSMNVAEGSFHVPTSTHATFPLTHGSPRSPSN